MSARDDLFHRLVVDAGLSPHWADRQIGNFAHELAEEIRAAWAAHDPKKPGNVTMLSALNAADLIDPSVSPVRPDEEPT